MPESNDSSQKNAPQWQIDWPAVTSRTQEAVTRVADLLRVPPRLRLSEWADRHYYLSAESSGTEGPWRTLPYQRAILDVIGGDYVTTVTFQKSARVGYTKALVAAIAYWTSYKRRSGAIWQPTDSDAAEFKKDELNPSMRDVETFRSAMLSDPDVKSKHNTVDRVAFEGATLYVRGGKAARSYRRLTLDFACYDELDGFDHDVEGEGPATSLGDVRLTASAFPKSIRGSTPRTHNESQIERSLSQAGAVFYRELPCPKCGAYHRLEWKRFHYDKADPQTTARFECPACKHRYGYEAYSAMDALGRWATDDGRVIDEETEELHDADGAQVPWPHHVGFFIWAAHSYLQSWGRLAELWLEASAERKRTGDQSLLKAFVNTQLAETWKEIEESISPEALMSRREQYAAQVPAGALVLTMGVDTQDDRLEYEVVGHGLNGETWGIEYGVLHGDPADSDVFKQLDAKREQTWTHESGAQMRVVACGIDSGGHRTRQVYEYCRPRHGERVYCLFGRGGEGVPITRAPSKLKITQTRTVRLYTIGVDALKARWYASLLRSPSQHGYVHIPEAYSLEWCEQALAEVYVEKFERGRRVKKWKALRARNEALDVRNYAMAAFTILNPRLELLKEQSDAEAAPEQQPAPRRRRPVATGREKYFRHRGGR